MKYLALLRGINVGGNNKVSMSQLKTCFESRGFTNVITYINSGNVIFETSERSEIKLMQVCQEVIQERFGFAVVTMVIAKTNFDEALAHAPKWWGIVDRKELRSDALFVIPPATTGEVRASLKVKTDGPDKFAEYGQVVFWSLPMEAYNKSVVPKIIGTPVYKNITIRSSTTVKKLQALLALGS